MVVNQDGAVHFLQFINTRHTKVSTVLIQMLAWNGPLGGIPEVTARLPALGIKASPDSTVLATWP